VNNYTRSKKSTQDIREITKRGTEDFGEARTLEYIMKAMSFITESARVIFLLPVSSIRKCFPKNIFNRPFPTTNGLEVLG
jgi:hypothetical protein